MGFLAEHLIEIFFGLLSAGALALCKYFHKQLKNYQKLLEERESHLLEETIENRIDPIEAEIEDLRKYIRKTESIEKNHIDLIIASYRYRLIQLCKEYIKQQYMTQDQYDQLTEFYKLYTSLGGNGQAEDYYDTALKLPIHQ